LGLSEKFVVKISLYPSINEVLTNPENPENNPIIGRFRGRNRILRKKVGDYS
jgi:hypothetical protein